MGLVAAISMGLVAAISLFDSISANVNKYTLFTFYNNSTVIISPAKKIPICFKKSQKKHRHKKEFSEELANKITVLFD